MVEAEERGSLPHPSPQLEGWMKENFKTPPFPLSPWLSLKPPAGSGAAGPKKCAGPQWCLAPGPQSCRPQPSVRKRQVSLNWQPLT